MIHWLLIWMANYYYFKYIYFITLLLFKWNTMLAKYLSYPEYLDPNNLENYWPVSKLQFLSKIVEKSVITQLHEFLNNHNILENIHEVLRQTTVQKLFFQRLLIILELNYSQKRNVLESPDHQILLSTFRSPVGLSGNVLSDFIPIL